MPLLVCISLLFLIGSCSAVPHDCSQPGTFCFQVWNGSWSYSLEDKNNPDGLLGFVITRIDGKAHDKFHEYNWTVSTNTTTVKSINANISFIGANESASKYKLSFFADPGSPLNMTLFGNETNEWKRLKDWVMKKDFQTYPQPFINTFHFKSDKLADKDYFKFEQKKLKIVMSVLINGEKDAINLDNMDEIWLFAGKHSGATRTTQATRGQTANGTTSSMQTTKSGDQKPAVNVIVIAVFVVLILLLLVAIVLVACNAKHFARNPKTKSNGIK